MSTGDIAHQEQLPVPRRHVPAYGEVAAPPATAEPNQQTEGPLNPRTEALLALAIVTPVMAAYGAIAYGLHVAAEAVL